MKEEQMREILNIALFAYCGTTEEYMQECCGFSPENIQIGIKLNKFLQEKLQ